MNKSSSNDQPTGGPEDLFAPGADGLESHREERGGEKPAMQQMRQMHWPLRRCAGAQLARSSAPAAQPRRGGLPSPPLAVRSLGVQVTSSECPKQRPPRQSLSPRPAPRPRPAFPLRSPGDHALFFIFVCFPVCTRLPPLLRHRKHVRAGILILKRPLAHSRCSGSVLR